MQCFVSMIDGFWMTDLLEEDKTLHNFSHNLLVKGQEL